MTEYHLDNNTLFVYSDDGENLELWKLDNNAMYGPNVSLSPPWKKLSTIHPNKGEKLILFGKVIEGDKLKELAAKLGYRAYSANREGYLYAFLKKGGGSAQRLNDLFGWSYFGVEPKVTSIWNRCDVHSTYPVVNLQEKDKEFQRCKSLLEEKEKNLQEKDKEFQRCKSLLEEKEKELQACKAQLKEKETEVSILIRHLDSHNS